LRERLKKVAKPLSRVRANASSFMKPTIRTSPLVASWATAGIKPPSFEKSICVFFPCFPGRPRLLRQKKAPPDFGGA
jgi:hypothetical protein